ncbi:MAG: hypothetical protein B7Y39_19930 [Bdellovibrio sp. 28-41-41]|nr:MAG: hypothetical protein B7Y39_19930 [Bdellovibrio sp. 28-41-41]
MNTILKTLTIALFSIVFTSTALAHEDHDHDGPSSFQPQKGGVVKSTESLNIEVVNKDTKLEIYTYDMDGKVLDSTAFGLKANMKLPKSKKLENLKLDNITDSATGKFSHFEVNSKPKNTHRYTLVLEAKGPKEHHADKIEFTIELKK